jgi:serine/threonine-protein kinase
VSDDLTGPPTQGPPALPAPRPNGLFAGPPEAPDRFELLGEGLRGGEGLTWRASYHGALRSAVPLAVKVLNRPPGVPGDWPSPETLQRWKDRTVLLQHLHLERVVWLNEIFVGAPPHRHGEQPAGPPVPYLVMEWIDGPTLADLAGGEPVTSVTLAPRMQYVYEVAQALHELHAASQATGNPSLHRDIKPTNCIVNPARGVVLIDVGGMRTLDDGYDTAGMHTPAYTAPEILRNPYRPREAAGDRYALGALAVFCLLGEDPPAAGAALPDLIAPRLTAVVRSAGAAQPEALVAHVLAMLRADPASRPADGPGWARRLRSLAASTRTPEGRRPRWPMPTAVALAAAAALGGGVAVAAPWKQAETVAAPEPSAAVTSEAVVGRPAPSPTVTGSVASLPGPAATTRPASAATTSAAAHQTATRVPTTAPATTKAVATSGSITSPATGSGVKNCAYFSGSARLADGKTLILAMRNLDNGDPRSYVEFVFGYDKPSTLASWRGAQYFGGAPGQWYEVTLMAVDLDAAKAADAAGTAATNNLAKSGSRLASRKVAKIDGDTGDACPGP